MQLSMIRNTRIYKRDINKHTDMQSLRIVEWGMYSGELLGEVSRHLRFVSAVFMPSSTGDGATVPVSAATLGNDKMRHVSSWW